MNGDSLISHVSTETTQYHIMPIPNAYDKPEGRIWQAGQRTISIPRSSSSAISEHSMRSGQATATAYRSMRVWGLLADKQARQGGTKLLSPIRVNIRRFSTRQRPAEVILESSGYKDVMLFRHGQTYVISGVTSPSFYISYHLLSNGATSHGDARSLL